MITESYRPGESVPERLTDAVRAERLTRLLVEVEKRIQSEDATEDRKRSA